MHFADYFALYGNPRVMELITGTALSEDQARARFRKVTEDNRTSGREGVYRISTRDRGVFIGMGKLIRVELNEAEIGYALLPGFWRRGYASEISEELVRTASLLPGLSHLIAIIDPANHASERILRKSGFVLRKRYVLDGLPAEMYELALSEF